MTEIDSTDIPFNIDHKPVRNLGILVLLVTFGVFGTWSFLAPIDSSALAIGSVAVKSHRKTVQHLDGGIIRKILVKEGDSVIAGADLVILDDTQINAQLKMLRGQFIAHKSLSERLEAERNKMSEIRFSHILNEMDDDRVQQALEGQRNIFKARKISHEGAMAVLRQRIQQLESKISGLTAQRKSKKELANSFNKEIKGLAKLLADGYVEKQRLLDLERNLTITKGDIATITSEIATTQMQRGETQLEILQSDKKIQEDIAHQFEETNVKLFDIFARLQAIEDKKNRTVIKAPVTGVVFNLSIYTEGGVITSGAPILDLVPEGVDLIIRAQVSPLDIDRVTIGAIAEVRFSAFSNKTTPTMEGEVKKISADSLINESNGIPFYLATIELTYDSQNKLGDLKLIPGMPVEVLINTGERTLFEYLMQPISDAFAKSFIEE